MSGKKITKKRAAKLLTDLAQEHLAGYPPAEHDARIRAFRERAATLSPRTPSSAVAEQDRWLLENRDMINAKIRHGIEQLDRGEGIPEDQLHAYLAKLKAKR
jgi:hypothetical protein